MTTLFQSVCPASLQAVFTLQELAGKLVAGYLPVAASNRNCLVNDIPSDLPVGADREMIATILSGMLAAIIKNARNSYIRLSASMYGNVILVYVKDYSSFKDYPVESTLQRLQPLAERLKGSVGITSRRQNVTTFVFSFSNRP